MPTAEGPSGVAIVAWVVLLITFASVLAGLAWVSHGHSMPYASGGPSNGAAIVRPSNGSATTWSVLNVSHAPPGLAAGGAMAWDPVDQYLVLFGGCSSGDFWFSTCSPTNQTWVLATNSTGVSDWAQLNTPVAPPARFYSSLTWDDSDGYLVLFGGNGSATTGFLNDTWTFVHGAWTQLTPSVSPGARAGASLTYDAAAGSVILFGGERFRTLVNPSTNTYVGADYADTWSFSHGNWTKLSPSVSPTARDAASVAYDVATGSVDLFGGFNWTTYNQNDAWSFAGGTWSAIATNSSAPPGVRNNGAMTYDPAASGDVLFGGHAGYSFYSDTWTLSNGTWVQAYPAYSPSSRWGASLAYDPAVGCPVLYGGYNIPGVYYNDTWAYGTNCTGVRPGGGPSTGNSSGNSSGNLTLWHLVPTAHTPPGLAAGGAMAWDPVDQYLVLFGGCSSGNFWFSTCSPTNQTWVFSTNATGVSDWTQLSTPVAPPARFYSSLTWDDSDGYLVLFGGNGSATTGFLNDTWTFVHGAWTQLTPSVSPAARAGASMTYDTAAGRVILFGGEQYRTLVNASTNSYVGADYNDTWSFAHGNWTKLSPSVSPTARDAASVAYDPATGTVDLFGGFNWTTYNQNDAWSFAGGTWSAIATNGSATPWPRNNGAMAYDPTLSGNLLFGGHDGFAFYSDTWVEAGANWTYVSTNASPQPRWGASLAFDPVIGCAVLYGGFLGLLALFNNWSFTYYNDTWTFGSNCTGLNDTSPSPGSSQGNSTGGPSGNSSGGGNGATTPPGPSTPSFPPTSSPGPVGRIQILPIGKMLAFPFVRTMSLAPSGLAVVIPVLAAVLASIGLWRDRARREA